MAGTALLGWTQRSRLILLTLGILIAAPAHAKKDDPPSATPSPAFATLHIPHLDQSPGLNDFLGMQPGEGATSKMLKVEGFLQRDPKDGAAISQKTEAYVGYTDKNLYVVAICFDTELRNIRARLSR